MSIWVPTHSPIILKYNWCTIFVAICAHPTWAQHQHLVVVGLSPLSSSKIVRFIRICRWVLVVTPSPCCINSINNRPPAILYKWSGSLSMSISWQAGGRPWTPGPMPWGLVLQGHWSWGPWLPQGCAKNDRWPYTLLRGAGGCNGMTHPICPGIGWTSPDHVVDDTS